MNKKATNILIAALLLLITLGGIFFYLKYSKGESTHNTVMPNANTETGTRQLYNYTGDNGTGYLLKGKLLDINAKNEYNQLPDTLFFLKFGEPLYCTSCNAEPIEATKEIDTVGKDKFEIAEMQFQNEAEKAAEIASVKKDNTVKHYSPFTQKLSVLGLSSTQKNLYPNALLAYIKLADEGKASYPIFGTVSVGSVVNEFEFAEKFHHQFEDETAGEIPYLIKEKIMDFLNTDEGGQYTLERKDTRWYPHLIVQGNFRNDYGKDVALILQPKNEYDSYREKLIIFSTKNAGQVYILYNETNYEKTLLEKVPKTTSSANEAAVFYKDSEEPNAQATNDCLRIKQEGKADIVLMYDRDFDKMVPYIQKPKSEQESVNDNQKEN